MILSLCLETAQKRLEKAGVDNPSLDARLLVSHALGLDRAALLVQRNRLLTEEEKTRIEKLLARREKREPVGRILGLREFWGLPFALNEATLEPRPDSETLIEAALENVEKRNPRILDLGTGTGCLLIALLREWPEARGLGLDLSPRAVAQAQENAVRLEVGERATFKTGNWLKDLSGQFDLIVSNPPYIPTRDIETLQEEVRRFDPPAALDGGADGLDAYRWLVPRLPAFLEFNGWALFEVGVGQAQTVVDLMDKAGFGNIRVKNDLSGIPRCVAGQKASI